MKKTIQNLAFAFIAVLLHACYSSPDLSSLSNDLVVATEVDTEIDFTNYQTYYLSDTISVVRNSINIDSILVPPESTPMINKIVENMTARGYTRDTNPANIETVDIAVASSIIRITNTGQSCWGWWGGYPGYWPPWYWGPGYGYYYPYCSYYKYDTGTLLLEYGDIKNKEDNRRVNIIWNSAMFGVLSSYEQTNINRAVKAIDQAFEQSPYIETN